jgi:S1-C subfamily serine protease
MRAHYETRGWLGIEMDMSGTQPVVTRVVERSPAADAGFRSGDTLTSVNGISFSPGNDAAMQEFMKNGFKIGDTVVYTADREGSIVTLTATLAKISDEALAKMIHMHHDEMTHKDTRKKAKEG